MVMRYVSQLRPWAILALSLGMTACAFNNDKSGWNYDGSSAAQLMPTEIYLPVQARSDDGTTLPYQAQPNPYEALTGRIEREVIDRYIEARRAFQNENYDAADA